MLLTLYKIMAVPVPLYWCENLTLQQYQGGSG
jgi:hypothetical protein